MKIVPNSLLKPTEKCIKVWNCSYIATEGPNILSKISLEDLAIPYQSQYRARLVLNPESTDQPLLFEGFLGSEVTFVMIKVTFDSELDPYYRYEKEKYAITYRYEDETTTRPINRLMILTGSEGNRIPQIYLNNPYEYSVTLDILMANIEQDDIIDYSNVNESIFSYLYYSSVISNENLIDGIPYTGSSQLVVLNDSSEPVKYIPYVNITSTELDVVNYKISITTSNELIILKFLTEFDVYQAYSRITWVQESDDVSPGAYRFMTSDNIYFEDVEYDGVDTIPPVISYYETSGSTIPSGLTLDLVHLNSGLTMVTGWTSDQLKTEIVSGVTDNWDGDLLDNVSINITKIGSIPTLDEIVEVGEYRLIFSVVDFANNLRSDTINNVYII